MLLTSCNNLILVTLTCVTFGFLYHFVRRRRQWSTIINKIPGPKGLPLLGISWHLLTSRENVTKEFQALMAPFVKQYPLIKVWLGPIPIIYICKAEAAKILLNNNKQIKKARFYRYLHNWLGTGLIMSDGLKWQQRRKLITPSFHFRILENFLLVMNEQAQILVQLLSKQTKYGDFDIYPFVTRCTLDIICETAMGQGVNAQSNEDSEYVRAVDSLTRAFKLRLLRPWLAIDWIYRMSSLGRLERHSLSIVHGFTNAIIKMKRLNIAKSKLLNELKTEHTEDEIFGKKRRLALLDMLLEKSEDTSDGGQLPLTDEDIREEVNTFMFGGHDTTSVAISWSLYCIGQHPNIQQKIVDELNSVYESSDQDSTSQDLHNLKYLECVIKESMRLFPPVPGFARHITEDLDICGYHIPEGVTVMVTPMFIHRDPAYFPDPESFDPDRFLPDNMKDRDAFAYIPFSAGLRNCIGQKFAMMEVKVLLSRILRRFKVTTAVEEDRWSNYTGEIVLRPIRGIRVQLQLRQN